jgi:Xaa-Pro aminopeptidase
MDEALRPPGTAGSADEELRPPGSASSAERATLLVYGAPDGSADLFHAVPVGIVDPFLYAEAGGRRAATVSVLDADKVRALGVEVMDPYTLGRDELLEAGRPDHEIDAEISLRACRALRIERAIVPFSFPVAVADHLRAAGLELRVDQDAFVERRRRKTGTQLEGIRRAQKAADAAMAVAARLIRELAPGITSEEVRTAMQAVCDERGCELPDDVIVSHGAQSAVGHESGHGEIGAGEPVVVDIWPRDKLSRCWADMTRTFVGGGGEPPEELVGYWELTRASLDAVYPMVRAGADCRAIYEASCRPFHDAGQPTQLTKEPGTVLEDGYFHGLGHGVGLEIHERPGLGRSTDTLLAGDVVTLEPGCYRRGFGGCRLEDLVVVTDDGC